MSLDDNRIVRLFAELRAKKRKTLLPFVTAGYPSLAATAAILKRFEAIGVRVCELGVPFTDPIADGPVIQNSYTEALAAGTTTDQIFDVIGDYRAAGGDLALLAMVSYSIIYRHGPRGFIARAAAAGIDGLIVPDLPVDESASTEALASEAGLALVLLIAPTTPPERQARIARHSRGFIYYISVAGITGERDSLPDETIAAVTELRTHTDTPVCVGFGISNPRTVEQVCRVADGAIVGSAIVRRMTDLKDAPPAELAEKVGGFVAELFGPVK